MKKFAETIFDVDFGLLHDLEESEEIFQLILIRQIVEEDAIKYLTQLYHVYKSFAEDVFDANDLVPFVRDKLNRKLSGMRLQYKKLEVVNSRTGLNDFRTVFDEKTGYLESLIHSSDGDLVRLLNDSKQILSDLVNQYESLYF